MKLSCLFSVVMCFGIGAMMALPIDDESFESSNTDHYHEDYHEDIPSHRVKQNAPRDDMLKTWKSDEDGVAALHSKPNVYGSPKHWHYDRNGYSAPVEKIEDTPNVVLENVSISTNVPETNSPYAADVPVPLRYYVEDDSDVVFENISIVTNASETNLPYAMDIPLIYYGKDSLDAASENISIAVNISEANPPYALDIPLEHNAEDDIGVSIIPNGTSVRYAMDIPLEYHVDGVIENISINYNDPETILPYHIAFPIEYHEHVEFSESSEEGNINITAEFSELENASSAIIVIPDESMVDRTEITVNCTNCTDIFENTAEPKLIGCMCALFTTEHPTDNDIPLTSRTFHNVSCQEGVHSEDACKEVCVGVATINNELMDRMVCSFVPDYVYKLKAFLQSKLCEENAQWNFTGISSPSPICCYMGTQFKC